MVTPGQSKERIQERVRIPAGQEDQDPQDQVSAIQLEESADESSVSGQVSACLAPELTATPKSAAIVLEAAASAAGS